MLTFWETYLGGRTRNPLMSNRQRSIGRSGVSEKSFEILAHMSKRDVSNLKNIRSLSFILRATFMLPRENGDALVKHLKLEKQKNENHPLEDRVFTALESTHECANGAKRRIPNIQKEIG
jgi:hypothetical protein